MRQLFTLLFAGLSTALFAQATFNAPESVEYDAVYHRWLVGNNGSGEIVSYYPQSNLTVPFASGMTTGPHGIEILGNTAYACDGGSIKGFDLVSGAQVFNLSLGATFLNGLTTDGSTYLFATDFSAKKIYRINPSANAFNLMTTTAKTPNGIIYDGANNRCVFVTWGTNAPIQAMSMLDSTITTLLATSLSNCDGITRDNAGYWYVTTWGGNALRMIDPAFASAPVSVMTGLSSPADIDINTAGDSIGIPNNGNLNNVVFYTSITTNNGPIICYFDTDPKIYPNPAVDKAGITTDLYYPIGTAEILDARGRLIKTKSFYGQSLELDLNDLPAGNYIVRITGLPEAEPEFFKLVKAGN